MTTHVLIVAASTPETRALCARNGYEEHVDPFAPPTMMYLVTREWLASFDRQRTEMARMQMASRN